MTALVIPFPVRAQEEHRSWCVDHSTDPGEPGWWGECHREIRVGAAAVVVTQDQEQDMPVVLLEANGVHLTPDGAVQLYAELGRLLAGTS